MDGRLRRLVIIGVTPQDRKKFVAAQNGYRESEDSGLNSKRSLERVLTDRPNVRTVADYEAAPPRCVADLTSEPLRVDSHTAVDSSTILYPVRRLHGNNAVRRCIFAFIGCLSRLGGDGHARSPAGRRCKHPYTVALALPAAPVISIC